MKRPRAKAIITVLLALLTVAAVIAAVMAINAHAIRNEQLERDRAVPAALAQAGDEVDEAWEQAVEKALARFEGNARVCAQALDTAGAGDDAIALPVENGAIVGIRAGTVVPEDALPVPGITAEDFEGDRGAFVADGEGTMAVAYARIGTSDRYYVEWREASFLTEAMAHAGNIPLILQNACEACDAAAMLALSDGGEAEGFDIVFSRGLPGRYTDIAQMGLNGEALARCGDSLSQTLTLEGRVYRYAAVALPGYDAYLVLLSQKVNTLAKSVSQYAYMVIVLAILMTGFVVFALSLRAYIEDHPIDERMRRRYAPAAIRRSVLVYGLLGVVLIATAGIYDNALNDVYDATRRGREALANMEASLQAIDTNGDWAAQDMMAAHTGYGQRAAAMVDHFPALREKSALAKLAGSMGANGITLYDGNGREIVSSTDFLNLTLGVVSGSPTYDFKRILKGVPSIFRGAQQDEVTGLTQAQLGVRIDDYTGADAYGVMLIDLPAALMRTDSDEMIVALLEGLDTEATLQLIADAQTGRIEYSGERDRIGESISALGLSQDDLKDALMKHVRRDNRRWFFISSALSDTLMEKTGTPGARVAFYAEDTERTGHRIAPVVLGCLAFAVLFALLAAYALGGYDDAFFLRCIEKNGERIAVEGDIQPMGSVSPASEGRAKHWLGLKERWRSMRPEARSRVCVGILIVLMLMQQLPGTSIGNLTPHDSAYEYVRSGSWDRGLNIFSISSVLLFVCEAVLIVVYVRLLIRLIGKLLGHRGETVCRLINNIIKYVAVIVVVIKVLIALGADQTTVLASTGICSLAVSMGSQNLVANLVAGIMMVFEGGFHVGDVVEIDDVKGVLIEIGACSTKLLDTRKNIVSIDNREINRVLNTQRTDTRVKTDVSIAVMADQPLQPLMAILEAELARTAEGDDRFLTAPKCQGITDMQYDTMTLKFVTYCRYENMDEVKREVYHTLQRTLLENNQHIM